MINVSSPIALLSVDAALIKVVKSEEALGITAKCVALHPHKGHGMENMDWV